MKYCYACKETKDSIFFGRNKSKKDGLSTECKDCKRSLDKMYAKLNKETINQRAKKWYYNNKEYALERNKQYSKLWRIENKDKNCSKSNKYRASKLQATPCWVDEEHKWLIDEVYHLAQVRNKFTKFSWHVDHVVPFKGKDVCGLHVVENLQVIPSKENLQKGNKHVSV